MNAEPALAMSWNWRRRVVLRAVGLLVLVVFSATVVSGCAHGVTATKQSAAATRTQSPPVQDQEPRDQSTAEEMVADLVLLRPLGIVATVIGTAVFIVSLPFSVLGGNTKEAFHRLVIDPATFTFKRPLGKPKDS